MNPSMSLLLVLLVPNTRSANCPRQMLAVAAALLGILAVISGEVFADDHRAEDRLTLDCRDTVISGRSGAWDTIWSAAQRNARIRWRIEVRSTPTFGRSWDDWGIANRDVPFSDCNGGYCCRTKKILGVRWHQCSAYAQPCRYVDVPREGEIEQPPPRRTGSGLIIEGMTLKADRVSRADDCPAIVVLRATLTATGDIGSVRLRLRGGNDTEEVVLDEVDFESGTDGMKTATHSFLREFNGIVDRGYSLSVEGRTRWGDEPRRVNPTRVSVNCRNAGIGGLTAPALPPH